MKKRIIILSLMILLFFSVGCQDVKTTAPESTPSPVSITAPTVPEPPSDETPPHKESPLALHWYSGKDYRAFREATALSDEELISFLDREGYAREGIVSRTEFEKIIAYMDKMSPYFFKVHPSVEKVEGHFSLYLDDGNIDLVYGIEGRMYRFQYFPKSNHNSSVETHPEETMSFVFGERTVELYVSTRETNGAVAPFYYGSYEQGNYIVWVWVWGNPGETSVSPTEVAALFAKDTPAID